MTNVRRSLSIVFGVMLIVLSQVASIAASNGVVARATGGGEYQLLGTLPAKFAFAAVGRPDGSASGQIHHSVVLGGELIEFYGEVTCVSVDPVNDRAWIGGVITRNNSTHPSFLAARNQVGRDIWFRAVDYGEGSNAPEDDRTTFVGFEGDAGFITSAAYCAGQPWPEGDARTWPVTKGNIQVGD